jgi:hypothetical protein
MVLNPVSSMRKVYGPAGSAARNELAIRVADTFARTPGAFVRGENAGAGMTAPELSRTSPTSVAVVTCACAEADTRKKKSATNNRTPLTMHDDLAEKNRCAR